MNKEKKSKNIILSILGCIVVAALIFALAQAAGYLLDPRYAQDGIDVIKAFDSLEEDSVDVIVYGSSRAWKGVDTRVMYDDYGINAYNYSANWLSLNTTLLFLQNSLKTQKPKIVCIETGLVDDIEKDVDLDGQIYCTRYMRPSKEKREFLKTCFGKNIERYASYYFPIIMFHDNWSRVNYENIIKPDKQRYIDSRGFYATYEAEPFEAPDYTKFTQKELNEDSLEILDKMVSFCNENGIQIIFFTCPYADQYNYGEEMTEYSANNGCAYLNLFEYTEEMGLDYKTDLKDYEHLNESGAGKTAAFLAEYIIDYY